MFERAREVLMWVKSRVFLMHGVRAESTASWLKFETTCHAFVTLPRFCWFTDSLLKSIFFFFSVHKTETKNNPNTKKPKTEPRNHTQKKRSYFIKQTKLTSQIKNKKIKAVLKKKYINKNHRKRRIEIIITFCFSSSFIFINIY